MHTNPETLGDIIKFYREKSNYTVEKLANSIGITERYLYRIENEGKKPSYEVLYRIIRTLSISSDIIFYPESSKYDNSIKRISNMLISCDDLTIRIIETILEMKCNSSSLLDR